MWEEHWEGCLHLSSSSLCIPWLCLYVCVDIEQPHHTQHVYILHFNRYRATDLTYTVAIVTEVSLVTVAENNPVPIKNKLFGKGAEGERKLLRITFSFLGSSPGELED